MSKKLLSAAISISLLNVSSPGIAMPSHLLPVHGTFSMQALSAVPTHFPPSHQAAEEFVREGDFAKPPLYETAIWTQLGRDRFDQLQSDIAHLVQINIVVRRKLFLEFLTQAFNDGLDFIDREPADALNFLTTVEAFLDFVHVLSEDVPHAQRVESGLINIPEPETPQKASLYPFVTIEYPFHEKTIRTRVIFQETRLVARAILQFQFLEADHWVAKSMIRLGADGHTINALNLIPESRQRDSWITRLLHMDIANFEKINWVQHAPLTASLSSHRDVKGIGQDYSLVLRNIKLRLNQLPAESSVPLLDALRLSDLHGQGNLSYNESQAARLDLELAQQIQNLASLKLTTTTDSAVIQEAVTKILKVLDEMQRYLRQEPPEARVRSYAVMDQVRNRLGVVLQVSDEQNAKLPTHKKKEGIKEANSNIKQLVILSRALTHEPALKILTIAVLLENGQVIAAHTLRHSLDPLTFHERQEILDALLLRKGNSAVFFRAHLEEWITAHFDRFYDVGSGQWGPALRPVLGELSTRVKGEVRSDMDIALRAYLPLLQPKETLKPRLPGPHAKLLPMNSDGNGRGVMSGVPSQASLDDAVRSVVARMLTPESAIVKAISRLLSLSISDNTRAMNALAFAANQVKFSIELWKKQQGRGSLAVYAIEKALDTVMRQNISPLRVHRKTIGPKTVVTLESTRQSFSSFFELLNHLPKKLIYTATGALDVNVMVDAQRKRTRLPLPKPDRPSFDPMDESSPMSGVPVAGSTWEDRSTFVHQEVVNHLLDVPGLYNQEGITIVDFGVGEQGAPTTFELAKKLSQGGFKNVHIIGIDENADRVALAQAEVPLHFMPGISIEFKTGGYHLEALGVQNVDAIIASNVISHMSADTEGEARKYFYSVLKEQGRLFVSEGPFKHKSRVELSIFNARGEIVKPQNDIPSEKNLPQGSKLKGSA